MDKRHQNTVEFIKRLRNENVGKTDQSDNQKNTDIAIEFGKKIYENQRSKKFANGTTDAQKDKHYKELALAEVEYMREKGITDESIDKLILRESYGQVSKYVLNDIHFLFAPAFIIQAVIIDGINALYQEANYKPSSNTIITQLLKYDFDADSVETKENQTAFGSTGGNVVNESFKERISAIKNEEGQEPEQGRNIYDS
jgi:hypothetical protein